MNFDWATLALQTINFLILVWLLRRFLYRPVLAMIDRRRAETDVARQRAEAAERQGQAAEQEWRGKAEELERDAARLRRDAEAEAARRGEAVIAAARRQAEHILAEAAVAIAAERAAAETELERCGAELAAALAARLLALVAPGVGAEPFLDILAGRLKAMAPSERALLAHGAARIEVAPPLAAGREEYWRGRLAGDFPNLAIVEASDLIAGARLVTPAAVLEVSWADALGRARQEMV